MQRRAIFVDNEEVRRGRTLRGAKMKTDKGSVEVLFDAEAKGVSVLFGVDEPGAVWSQDLLWWARPASPDEISAVVRFVAQQRLPVSTIVIGGLEGYPIQEHLVPRWLVEMAQVMAPGQLVVDTRGLDEGRRRRLIRGTMRACQLVKRPRDPVAALVDWIGLQIKGWMG